MSCTYCEERLIDYIDRNLEAEEMKEMEMHLKNNADCDAEYRAMNEMISVIKEEKLPSPPPLFMNAVREKVQQAKPERKRSLLYRPGAWVAAIVFSFLFVGTAFATNGFNDLLDWWIAIADDQQERVDQTIEHGLGERVNIAVVDQNVKVTITDVVADDLQTYIYYEIEDLAHEKHLMIDFHEGTEVVNKNDVLMVHEYVDHSLRSHMRLYSDQDHVVKGRMGLAPSKERKGSFRCS